MRTPDLIGSAEACEILGVDRSTLVRWVASERIGATKLSGQTGAYVFSRVDVEALKAELAGQVASA